MNDFNILFPGQLEACTLSLYFWSWFWTQVDARSSINNFVWLLLWVLGSSWCSKGVLTSGKTAARAELRMELDCRVFLDGSAGAIMLLLCCCSVELWWNPLPPSPSLLPPSSPLPLSSTLGSDAQSPASVNTASPWRFGCDRQPRVWSGRRYIINPFVRQTTFWESLILFHEAILSVLSFSSPWTWMQQGWRSG